MSAHLASIAGRRQGADLEVYRPRLFGIAYRMLGSVEDAEDVVQETFLRWHQHAGDPILDPEGWLVTIVSRLAIDRLRRMIRDRERYVGPYLPEPAPSGVERLPSTAYDAPDRRAELASELSMAFLVLLERLSPEERAAFLLRDVFGSDVPAIARMLDRTETATRQMIHRARERVRADRARFTVPPEAKDELLDRFLAALGAEDQEAMMAVIAPDATITTDGGGKVFAARRVVRGSERVARMLVAMERKYEHAFTYRLARVNGEAAVLQCIDGMLNSITFVDTDGARVLALYRVMNPDKLRRVAAELGLPLFADTVTDPRDPRRLRNRWRQRVVSADDQPAGESER